MVHDLSSQFALLCVRSVEIGILSDNNIFQFSTIAFFGASASFTIVEKTFDFPPWGFDLGIAFSNPPFHNSRIPITMVKLKLSQPRCMAPKEDSLPATAQAPTIVNTAAPADIPAPAPAPGALAVASTTAPTTNQAPLMAREAGSIAKNKPTPAIEVRNFRSPPPIAPKSESSAIIKPAATPKQPAFAGSSSSRAIAPYLAASPGHSN